MQVEEKAAVGIDVTVDQRRDAAKVLRVESAGPCRFSQDLLDHEGVDVDEGELQEMKREHADLLVIGAVGSHLAAFPEEDEVVGAVPVLDDIETSVDLAPEVQRPKIATKEDGLLCFAEFGERTVDRVLDVGAGETAEDVLSLGGSEPQGSGVLDYRIVLLCDQVPVNGSGKNGREAAVVSGGRRSIEPSANGCS